MKKLRKYAIATCKLAVVALIASLSFVSCKKDKVTTNSINGTWEGKWGSGSQAPQYFLQFEIKSDGTLTRLNEQGQVIANGTWTLNGVQFDCTYTHTADGQVHKIGGLYTDFDGFITGTWGYSPSKTNGGNIELTKQ